jgi:hypothetical protein
MDIEIYFVGININYMINQRRYFERKALVENVAQSLRA